MVPGQLSFDADCAQLFAGAVSPFVDELRGLLDGLPRESAGVRIHGLAELRQFLVTDGMIGAIASEVIGRECRAVRPVLFDKTAAVNWGVGWHQDRTICVKQRLAFAGLGP